jgi:hypothetical protein
MSPHRPRLSVVIPAYNAERYLGAAIRSVAACGERAVEAVVVDDGSNDASASVARETCESLGLPHAVMRQPNRGAGMAREQGIQLARGEWLLFLDADDELIPGAVPLLLAASADADAVYGDAVITDAALVPTGRRNQRPRVAHPIGRMLFGAPLNGTVVLRRERAAGYWPERHAAVAEFYFHAALAIAGVRFRHVAIDVLRYRQHPDPERLTNRGFDLAGALAEAFLDLHAVARERAAEDPALRALFRWVFLDLALRVDDNAIRGHLYRLARGPRHELLHGGADALRHYGPRRTLRLFDALRRSARVA